MFIHLKIYKTTYILINYELNIIIRGIGSDRNDATTSTVTAYGQIRLYKICLYIINKVHTI